MLEALVAHVDPKVIAGHVMTRWGLIPARSTVDPAAVDAIDEPGWLLDLDAFQAETRELDVEAALQRLEGDVTRTGS